MLYFMPCFFTLGGGILGHAPLDGFFFISLPACSKHRRLLCINAVEPWRPMMHGGLKILSRYWKNAVHTQKNLLNLEWLTGHLRSPSPPFFFELWKWEIQVRRRESNGLKMDHDLLGFYLEAHFLGEGIPALDETEQRTVDVCL